MTTTIETHDAESHLTEYLDRVANGGERIVVERQGKPVAALVSVQDLKRLEAMSPRPAGELTDDERETRFRESLREAGIVVRWPTGKPISPRERRLSTVEGRPLSEDIVADREERDRLLSGQ